MFKNILVAFLVFTQAAYAGLPPTSSKGSNDSSPKTTFEYDFPNAVVTHTGTKASVAIPDAAGADSAYKNYVTNPGAETDVTTGVTLGGSATNSRNTTTPLYQTADFSIGFTTSSDKVTWALGTLDNQLKGQNCQFSFTYTASAMGGVVYAQVLQSTNVVAQSTALAVNSSPTQINLNAPCGDLSTTTTVVISSTTSATSTLKVDNLYYGLATNLSVGALPTVSWSGYHGSISGGCSSTSATFADVSACTGIALTELTNRNFGTVTTASGSLPGITFTPKRTGIYKVCAYPYQSGSGAANNWASRLVDGSSTIINPGVGGSINLAAGKNLTLPVCGDYNISSLASTTIKLQAAISGGGTTNYSGGVQDGGAQITWSIFSLDDQVQTAYTPDLQALSWSGYHTTASTWHTTSATLADPTVYGTPALTERLNTNFGTVTTAASNKAGLTFTPKITGKLHACANVSVAGSVSNEAKLYQLWDGTTEIATAQFRNYTNGTNGGAVTLPLCGDYNVASLSPVTLTVRAAATGSGGAGISDSTSAGGHPIEWELYYKNQNIPAPVLVGGFTNSYTGSNRIAWAYIANTCNSNPCTIASQSGDFTSITRTSTGAYVANFPANTFLLTPSCVVFSEAAVTFVDGAPSSTAWPFGTYNTAFSRVDYGKISIQCMNGR